MPPTRVRLVLALSCLLAMLAAVPRSQAPTGVLVRNGRLVDGTGGPARAADVRVSGDSIVEVAALSNGAIDPAALDEALADASKMNCVRCGSQWRPSQ